jgi:hypothetical protein
MSLLNRGYATVRNSPLGKPKKDKVRTQLNETGGGPVVGTRAHGNKTKILQNSGKFLTV